MDITWINRTPFPSLYLLCIVFSLIKFITCSTISGNWILEVQLRNYTNLYGAYHNFTEKSPCCCQSLQPTCKHELEHLDCGYPIPVPPLTPGATPGQIAKYCPSEFEFCIEGNCITYPEPYSTGVVTFNGAIGKDITIYSTLEYNGTFTKESVDFVITVYHQNSTLDKEHYVIDNFTIPLSLVKTSTFSSPIRKSGTYHIASFTIAYRLHCIANYYGNDCSVFCIESSSKSTGFFTCDNNGAKICNAGYTNPDNNCKDKATTTTSCVLHTTYFPSLCASDKGISTSEVATSNCTTYFTSSCTDKEISTSSTAEATHEARSRISANTLSTVIQPQSTTTAAHTTVPLATNSSMDTNPQHNQSSITSSCECEREDTAFAIVLTLLVLTYAGIILTILIKLWWIYFRSQQKFLSSGTILDNPNYDPPTTMENKEGAYAPLINSPLPITNDGSTQYELINSQGNMYEVIDN